MKTKASTFKRHATSAIGIGTADRDATARTTDSPKCSASSLHRAPESCVVPGGAQSYTPEQLRVDRDFVFLTGDAWLALAADIADAIEAHPELVELLK